MRKALVFVAVLALATSASAITQGQFGVGARAVGMLPFGDMGDVISFSPGVGANVMYGLTDAFTLEAMFAYYFVSIDDVLDEAGWSYTWMDLYLGGRYNFMPESEGFMPYVAAGAGLALWSVEWEFLGETWDASESDFGFNAGLGFTYPLGETMALDFSGRFHYIATEGSSSTYATFNLGFDFFFGGEY